MIDRRVFLKRSLLAAAALAGSACRTALPGAIPRGLRTQRIVVIGAGLAGLSAAWELVQAGHDVTVLEAQARPGGRVLTLREPFADGQYAEAGAVFVGGGDDFTHHYLRLFGLGTVAEERTPALRPIRHLRGRRIVVDASASLDWPPGLTAEEARIGVWGMWQRYLLPIVAEIGDPLAPGWPDGAVARYDRMSFATLLQSRGASPAAIELLRSSYIDLLGEGIESVSALSLLRGFAMPRGKTGPVRIEGGSDRLPRAFAARLGRHIRYDAPVVRIEQDATGVRVTTARGQLKADRVICAISFSILRGMEVVPPLSNAKRRVVDALSYTSVARVFLQMKRRFWMDRKERGAAETDLPIQSVYDDTPTQPGPRGILSAYCVGARARALGRLPEAERITAALADMERVHPGAKASFDRGTSKCWDEDPWARGDYCYFEPGQLSEWMPAIRASEGRIHFAGDHTSSWPGFMQGALESGHRVAEEVARVV